VVKLTELTTAGGCAAKYPAAQLEQLLRGFLPADSSDLLVGLDPADDAAVYRLDDERAIVFTLDFFPPIVDDPDDFGAIAATNALNDVFAMGGTPLLALSIAAFPEELDTKAVAAIFAAADRQVRAAGALLAGGHTIRDDEPKYGLAVVGTVHPTGLWPKAGARPGDAVFLTKPLGTALVLGGHKQGLVDDDVRDEAVTWMRLLNRDAADAIRPFHPNCVTDVTGFGLLGHAYEVADRSGVRLVLDAERLPAMEGALTASRAGVRNAGHPRNEAYAGASVTIEQGVGDELVGLAYDPQTAGGLLVTLPAEQGVGLQAQLDSRGLFLRRIGHVEAGAGVVLR
jgi:selenide,water dikinase